MSKARPSVPCLVRRLAGYGHPDTSRHRPRSARWGASDGLRLRGRLRNGTRTFFRYHFAHAFPARRTRFRLDLFGLRRRFLDCQSATGSISLFRSKPEFQNEARLDRSRARIRHTPCRADEGSAALLRRAALLAGLARRAGRGGSVALGGLRAALLKWNKVSFSPFAPRHADAPRVVAGKTWPGCISNGLATFNAGSESAPPLAEANRRAV